MLRLGTEAVTVEPDGRGAPDALMDGRKRRCRAGATGHRGRFTPATGLRILLRGSPQGYSPFGVIPTSSRSGECRIKAMFYAAA